MATHPDEVVPYRVHVEWYLQWCNQGVWQGHLLCLSLSNWWDWPARCAVYTLYTKETLGVLYNVFWKHLSLISLSVIMVYAIYIYLICKYVTLQNWLNPLTSFFVFQNVILFSNVISYNCNIYIWNHYNNVIMGKMVSQITSLTIVYSTVYLSAALRKHQSSEDRWIPGTKGQ